jgi:hypothetical protein
MRPLDVQESDAKMIPAESRKCEKDGGAEKKKRLLFRVDSGSFLAGRDTTTGV